MELRMEPGAGKRVDSISGAIVEVGERATKAQEMVDEVAYEQALEEAEKDKAGFEEAIAGFEKELMDQCPTEYATYMAGGN